MTKTNDLLGISIYMYINSKQNIGTLILIVMADIVFERKNMYLLV